MADDEGLRREVRILPAVIGAGIALAIAVGAVAYGAGHYGEKTKTVPTTVTVFVVVFVPHAASVVAIVTAQPMRSPIRACLRAGTMRLPSAAARIVQPCTKSISRNPQRLSGESLIPAGVRLPLGGRNP